MAEHFELGDRSMMDPGIDATEEKVIARPLPFESSTTIYPSGWRLHATTFGLCFALFMSLMDSSIASTAILVITDQLGGYDKSSWVFTSYLLTYSGFPIILSKASDMFGRKALVLLSLTIFTIFSGACGGAQTMIQLIMFRWIQGIGGSGIYAIVTLYFFELVPSTEWPMYSALVTSSIALSLIVAPLIGGAITISGHWRWIFLINVPMGCLALLVLFFVMPAKLDNEPAASSTDINCKSIFSTENIRRVDFVGAALLLGTCLLLTTALQEAAEGLSFSSSTVLPLLIISVMLCMAFLVWERYVATSNCVPEPILPWRFFRNRVLLGIMMNSFLSGNILLVPTVQIPQRFMTVNGSSPLAAGARLLPFAALNPASAALASIIMGRMKIPPIYMLLVGSVFEIAGVVGLSKSSTAYQISPSQYGFQALAGAGIGFITIALALLTPYAADNRDLAIGTGAVAQFRVLGGITGLSIVTCVSTPSIRRDLSHLLSASQVNTLLDRTEVLGVLPDAIKPAIRRVFGDGYNLQMTIMIGFAVAQIPATLMMWRKKPMVVGDQGGLRETDGAQG